MTVPNLITFFRLALVPVVGWALFEARYGLALAAFLAAALSDSLDGFIARRFGSVSELGAILDPIADKLNMLVATVFLAWNGVLPIWLAIAIVSRDAIIVGGALAYRLTIGRVEIAPTMLSKINTLVEFGALLLVMASAAGVLARGPWLGTVFAVVFATVFASGAHYVWVWGRKAAGAARRSRCNP